MAEKEGAEPIVSPSVDEDLNAPNLETLAAQKPKAHQSMAVPWAPSWKLEPLRAPPPLLPPPPAKTRPDFTPAEPLACAAEPSAEGNSTEVEGTAIPKPKITLRPKPRPNVIAAEPVACAAELSAEGAFTEVKGTANVGATPADTSFAKETVRGESTTIVTVTYHMDEQFRIPAGVKLMTVEARDACTKLNPRKWPPGYWYVKWNILHYVDTKHVLHLIQPDWYLHDCYDERPRFESGTRLFRKLKWKDPYLGSETISYETNDVVAI
jgi:hypothetical protein